MIVPVHALTSEKMTEKDDIIATFSGMSAVTGGTFGEMAGISGFNVPEIETLNYFSDYCALHIGELLFAGIIISSHGERMGMVMTVPITAGIAVFLVKNNNSDSQK